ncbi:MAG: manA [Glaciihabitans sp.]|nr:manA [Glaciihabitans sp.]
MSGPIVVSANQPPERFYLGGPRIAEFRHQPSTSDRIPEDWVASTTTMFGETALGLSTLPNGRLLRDAVNDDPRHWLGDAHTERWGSDAMMLVKLLDPGQQLPVHAHPDDAFAKQHLDHSHGKTEAWVVLQSGTVYLGFTREVSEEELLEWVRVQDTAAMLGAMHPITVNAGDGVLVPAGLPHAIGEGVFVLEIQQPEDLSILLQWDGFELDGEADGHLGLGFPLAVTAVDTSAWSADRIQELVTRGVTSGPLLPPASEPFFRADLVRGADGDSAALELEAGFSILIVIAGAGQLRWSDEPDGVLELRDGQTVLVPAAAGELKLSGDVDLVRFAPPRP